MSTTANQPQIHEFPEGNQIVVRFSGCTSLDEYNADRVGELLSKAGADHPDKHLVIDLEPIKFVTSTILGQFVALNKKLRSGGGKLGLRNLKPAVYDALRATLLDQVFEIQPPADKA